MSRHHAINTSSAALWMLALRVSQNITYVYETTERLK
jgi:hypothetical protein